MGGGSLVVVVVVVGGGVVELSPSPGAGPSSPSSTVTSAPTTRAAARAAMATFPATEPVRADNPVDVPDPASPSTIGKPSPDQTGSPGSDSPVPVPSARARCRADSSTRPLSNEGATTNGAAPASPPGPSRAARRRVQVSQPSTCRETRLRQSGEKVPSHGSSSRWRSSQSRRPCRATSRAPIDRLTRSRTR